MISLIIKIILWILAIILGINSFGVFIICSNQAIVKIIDKLEKYNINKEK